MAANKRLSKTAREAVLAEVAKLDGRGYTQREIAERLKVSQPQISYDLKVLRERYGTNQQMSVTAKREQQRQRLLDVLHEAWESWERSKQNTMEVTDEYVVPYAKAKPGDGDSAGATDTDNGTPPSNPVLRKRTKVRKQRLPDTGYINVALKAMSMLNDLDGLEAPKRVENSNLNLNWDMLTGDLPTGPVPDLVEAEIQALEDSSKQQGEQVDSTLINPDE